MVDESLLEYYYLTIRAMDDVFISHLYSPLYNKYFDTMTEDEIKKQIAVWLVED